MSMSIGGTSSYVSPLYQTQGAQTSQVTSSTDSDGDGDGSGNQVRRGHGGGQMQQALMQALQSLGLSVPEQPSGSSATTQPAYSSTDSDGDSDSSTSAPSGIKGDMKKFMQALFQAIKSDSPAVTGGATSTGSTTNSQSSFASGLSALISQVGNANAPTDLQNAFTQLSSDLQSANASSTTSSGTNTSTGSGSSSNITLQALLTKLQQNIGYGSSSLSSTGNFLNQVA